MNNLSVVAEVDPMLWTDVMVFAFCDVGIAQAPMLQCYTINLY